MKVHELKCRPDFFEAIRAGLKTHDLRLYDRDFHVFDTIVLREYLYGYTGRRVVVDITYITSVESPCVYSEQALHPEFCILSIQLAKEPTDEFHHLEETSSHGNSP